MPSLDAAKVDELRRLDHDGRLMARLREAFERTASRQRAELLAAAPSAQAAPAVQRAAHTLQAAAAQLGAGALADHCRKLELSAREGRPLSLPEDLQQLDRLLQDAQAELDRL